MACSTSTKTHMAMATVTLSQQNQVPTFLGYSRGSTQPRSCADGLLLLLLLLLPVLPPPGALRLRNAKMPTRAVRNGPLRGSARVIHATCILLAGHPAACAVLPRHPNKIVQNSS